VEAIFPPGNIKEVWMPLEPGLKSKHFIGYVVSLSQDSYQAHSKNSCLGSYEDYCEALNRVLREGFRQQTLLQTDQLGRPL